MGQLDEARSGPDRIDEGPWTEVGVIPVDAGCLVVVDVGLESELAAFARREMTPEEREEAVAALGGSWLPTGGDGNFGIDKTDGVDAGTVAIRVDTYGPVAEMTGAWRTERTLEVPSGCLLFADLPLMHKGYRLSTEVPAGRYLLQFFQEDGSAGIVGIRLVAHSGAPAAASELLPPADETTEE